MRWPVRRAPRHPSGSQRRFRFLESRERLERRFKRGIVALTVLACCGLLAGTRPGRYAVTSALFSTRAVLLHAIGARPGRPEIDAEWRARREFGVALTGDLLRQVYDEADPPHARLMREVGMAPGDAVLRWGNFDRTLLLSSRVFAPDDSGRSYRLRPNVRSVWLRNVTLPRGISCFFLVPETPGLPGLLADCGVGVVPGSAQSVNSWGCRGPEPDTGAAIRGLVLGDSFMQGLFVGDDETPSACLQRDLAGRTSSSVSVLNTGHLGYSPEQYYFTLLEYAGPFRPHFVILSICDNDFGTGDWQESAYWLGETLQYCRSRGLLCLTVPAPRDLQVTGRRRSGDYQGRLSNLLEAPGIEFCDPMEDFVDEHLRLTNERRRGGRPFSNNPLFNVHIDDGHFSPAGCKVWGRAVGRRLALLLERKGSTAPRESGGPGNPPRNASKAVRAADTSGTTGGPNPLDILGNPG